MSKLQTIKVKRFKQLKELELSLDDITVLVGANNSGKSSLLQAVHFAIAVAQTAHLVGDGVRWGNDRFELSFNPSQLIYSPVADVLSLAVGGVLVEDAAHQIEIELTKEDGSRCTVAVRRGRNRNIQVSIRGRQIGERFMNLVRPFSVYAPGLAGIAREERFMSPGAVRRVVARGDANLVLRNVLLMLSDSEIQEKERHRVEWMEQYRREDEAFRAGKGAQPIHWLRKLNDYVGPWTQFQRDMQAIFPGITVKVGFDREKDEFIGASFQFPNGPSLPIDAAGTSILQASQLLGYVALFKPEVLILDEPDSHLHPNNQRMLCDLVSTLVQRNKFRALISTHSRHVLDAMRDRSSLIWLSGGRKVEFDSVTTPALLMELGALDSVDYFANGQFTCLVATEDTRSDSLQALAAVLASNGFQAGGYEVRSYGGCSKIESAHVLRRFLADKAPRVKFILHRDRDYMSDESAARFDEQIRAMDAFPLLTEFSDIEGYFLSAGHVHALYPTVSAARAEELIAQATATTRDKSIEALINQRTEIALRTRNGGPAHNAGALAIQAQVDFDGDPVKWRRGKIVLNELRALLNREIGAHADLLRQSEHLRRPEIEAIKQAVWP